MLRYKGLDNSNVTGNVSRFTVSQPAKKMRYLAPMSNLTIAIYFSLLV